jgi:hypothetical protein
MFASMARDTKIAQVLEGAVGMKLEHRDCRHNG